MIHGNRKQNEYKTDPTRPRHEPTRKVRPGPRTAMENVPTSAANSKHARRQTAAWPFALAGPLHSKPST